MIKAIGEYVGGRVLTAVLFVTGAAAVIWFYKHPEHWDAMWSVIGRGAAWIGVVVALPWACFFAPRWIMRKDSNAAGVALLAAYLAVDVAAALLLAGGSDHGTFTWIVFILGFLAAGAYNLVVCDYQVSRLEERAGW